MRRILIAGCLGLASIAVATHAEPRQSAAIHLPKDIQSAQATVASWLNELSGETRPQIVARLGNPSKNATWKLQGKQELLLEYAMVNPKRTLQLYFFGDKVIKASLQFLSE